MSSWKSLPSRRLKRLDRLRPSRPAFANMVQCSVQLNARFRLRDGTVLACNNDVVVVHERVEVAAGREL